MRKIMLPLWAAGIVLFAFPSFAETYSGIVDGFDVEMSILFVDIDQEFVIPDDVELPDIEAGDTVVVEYNIHGDTKIATLVTLQQ